MPRRSAGSYGASGPCFLLSHPGELLGASVGICGRAGLGGSSSAFSDLQKRKMLSWVPEPSSIILI